MNIMKEELFRKSVRQKIGLKLTPKFCLVNFGGNIHNPSEGIQD
jgi:hypothetical protein